MEQRALFISILLTCVAAPSFSDEMMTIKLSHAIDCQLLNKADIYSAASINCYDNVKITERTFSNFPDNERLTGNRCCF